MHPKKRREQLLDLLQQANEPLSTKELATNLRVSIRTIQYDIASLNDWLEDNELAPIHMISQKGVVWQEVIPVTTINKKVYTPIERKNRMLLLLVFHEEAVTTETFIEQNNVSRSTVLEDLKELRSSMMPYEVSIDYDPEHGRFFTGKEKNIRHFLIQYLFINNQINEAADDIVKQINPNLTTRLHQIEEKLGINFTDEMQQRLIRIAHLFLYRIKAGYFVEKSDEINYQLESIGQYFYQGEVPPREAQFFGKFLLGANRIHDETASEELLSNCVTEIIDRFELLSSVTFKERDQLERDLLMHLKPAFFRVKHQLDIHHSMEETVKNNYPEIFDMTKHAMQPFEELLTLSMPQNELAFVAILFGGYLRKGESNLVKAKTVQIVCSMGVGTSRFIENQLQELLPKRVTILSPLSLRDFKGKNIEVDLIVSTIPLEANGRPVIIVDAMLTQVQKAAVLKALNITPIQTSYSIQSLIDIIERHAKITNYEKLKSELKQFVSQNQSTDSYNKTYSNNNKNTKDHTHKPIDETLTNPNSALQTYLQYPFIQHQTQSTNWKTAIRQAAQPLLDHHYITESYCQQMIANIEKYGPYVIVAPGVAMPHALPEHGIKQSSMSLLFLENPVNFTPEKPPVSFIFILAIIADLERLAVLQQLRTLLPKLKSTHTFSDIKRIIDLL